MKFKTGDTEILGNNRWKIFCNDNWYEIRSGDKMPFDRKTRQHLEQNQINILNPGFIIKDTDSNFLKELEAIV